MQPFFSNDLRNGIAILIDPEKVYGRIEHLTTWSKMVNESGIDYVFVGGSTVSQTQMQEVCQKLKAELSIPLIIFPGASHQVTEYADGILLLNLISSDNPDFLIGHHRAAASLLWNSPLQVYSTSYVLIDGGKSTKVQEISKSNPIGYTELDRFSSTLKAGRLIGHQLCYLEAGSGALNPVPNSFVQLAGSIFPFVIVGGGLRTIESIKEKHLHGANLVVIGNHLEDYPEFLAEIKDYKINLSAND